MNAVKTKALCEKRLAADLGVVRNAFSEVVLLAVSKMSDEQVASCFFPEKVSTFEVVRDKPLMAA